MSAYAIIYRDGHKVAVPVNREEYLQARRESKNIANLVLARKGNQMAKRGLAQFNYSCYPNADGTLKGATRPSATVAMDIDHVDNPDATAQDILERNEEQGLGIYMLEKTASGHGLHIVFKRNPQLDNEENIRHMAQKLGVEPDLQAKDITRVLFTTTDARNELYWLDDRLFADNGDPTPNPATRRGTADSRHVVARLGAGTGGVAGASGVKVRDDYMGIPYSKIIDAYWKLHYGGQTPTESNRNTLTYELASNLRHICGYSEAQLQHIIPCYDGFSEKERNEVIASAVSGRKTMMPRKMTEVLNYVRQNNVSDVTAMLEMEEQLAEDDRLYADALPPLPMGTRESVKQAEKGLTFPAIFTVGAIVGFLATHVKLSVHGVPKGLNIQSFIVGESGSGKGACTRIYSAWTRRLQAMYDRFYEKEGKWAKQANAQQSGTRELAPESNVRLITMNNTSANVSERLEAVKGVHSLSYASEADLVFSKWKSEMEMLTSMLRNAYDEDRFDREAKSEGAARCHIPRLLWNVIFCGTPDALYRLVTNVTDGFMNRMCLARTPDNTFTPYEPGSEVGFGAQELDTVDFVVDALQKMRGVFENEMFEQWNLEWMETIRIESLKQGADKVLARMRMRTPTSSARITMAAYILLRTLELMLHELGSREAVLRTLEENPEAWIPFADRSIDDDTRQFFLTVTDYMVENFLYFFADELNEAYNDAKYNRSASNPLALRSRNKQNVFDMLSSEFGIDEVLQAVYDVKGKNIARQSAHNMVTRWKQQGLVGSGNRRGFYIKAQHNDGGAQL